MSSAGVWSIYWTPAGRFLVIEWRLRGGGGVFEGWRGLARTYRDARSLIPVGVSYRLAREAAERPDLIESWF